MPHVADGLPALNGVVQRAVQDRGRNLLLQLTRNVSNRFQQSVQLEPIFGRSENNRCVIEEEQPVLNPLTELGQGGQALLPIIALPILAFPGLDLSLSSLAHVFGHKIPLVDHHDASSSLLDDHVGDLLVLLGDAAHGIDDQDGDIATGDGILGALH